MPRTPRKRKFAELDQILWRVLGCGRDRCVGDTPMTPSVLRSLDPIFEGSAESTWRDKVSSIRKEVAKAGGSSTLPNKCVFSVFHP